MLLLPTVTETVPFKPVVGNSNLSTFARVPSAYLWRTIDAQRPPPLGPCDRTLVRAPLFLKHRNKSYLSGVAATQCSVVSRTTRSTVQYLAVHTLLHDVFHQWCCLCHSSPCPVEYTPPAAAATDFDWLCFVAVAPWCISAGFNLQPAACFALQSVTLH